MQATGLRVEPPSFELGVCGWLARRGRVIGLSVHGFGLLGALSWSSQSVGRKHSQAPLKQRPHVTPTDTTLGTYPEPIPYFGVGWYVGGG